MTMDRFYTALQNIIRIEVVCIFLFIDYSYLLPFKINMVSAKKFILNYFSSLIQFFNNLAEPQICPS